MGRAMIFLMMLVFLTSASAQTFLDSSFGINGYTIVTPDLENNYTINEIALQPDSKIVAVGSGAGFIHILRFNADGTSDNTFATNGRLSFSQPNWTVAFGNSLILQPDGKIIVGGSAYDFFGTTPEDLVLIRVLANGQLDPTFGESGLVMQSFASHDCIYDLALQPDGKIIAAGTVGVSTPVIFRFLPDGQLDTTYGTEQGRTTWYNAGNNASGDNIRLLPDGSAIMQGNGSGSSGLSNYDFALFKVNPAGLPDSSFGTYGIARLDIVNGYEVGSNLAIQEDGKIVLCGSSGGQFSPDFTIARFKANGSLDSIFNGVGYLLTDMAGEGDAAKSVLVAPNGDFLLGGNAFLNGKGDFGLLRLNNNGVQDVTFGEVGKIISDFWPEWTFLSHIAMQGDGKIIAAGEASINNYGSFCIARFLPNGSTAIKDNQPAEIAISIFPNPADGRLQWTTGQPITKADISNAQGVLVLSTAGSNLTGIDIERLPTGWYLLRCTAATGMVWQKSFSIIHR